MIAAKEPNHDKGSTKRKTAIIHVLSSSQTIAVTPYRKFTVLKKTIPSQVTSINKSKVPTMVNPEIYEQRKRNLLEYKELFAALMKLRDKELQKKLLDVINNHRSTEYKNAETQTDTADFKVPLIFPKLKEEPSDNSVHIPSNESNKDHNISGNIKNASISGKNRKRRKRKVSLPQANKESRIKKLARLNKPKKSNVNKIPTPALKVQMDEISSRTRKRFNSFCVSECSSDVVNVYEDTETNYTNEILQSNYPLENGLLPIQDAVIRNQTNKLNMHISIWRSYKSIDLNDILTDLDEDLLQLAVLNSCDPSIINLLLQNGLNPNSLDPDSNTIVHLAILNDISNASFKQLIKKIDLSLILTQNDDGYTPLHLAIRQDRYLLAECLINILDERLVKQIFFKRPVDELETDENKIKQQFKDYYEKVCQQIVLDEETDSYVVQNHDLKQKLLQIGDRKSGNTALYFAIDNKFEHSIYFLLAHLTDPRTENLSGLDCKTYFSEVGKSLNIEVMMEKVIKLLS